MQVYSNTPLGVEDIEATLRHGKINISKAYTALYAFVWLLTGLPLLFGVLDFIFHSVNEGHLDLLLLGAVLFAATSFFFFNFNRGKRKVKKWLIDAVILRAKAQNVREGKEFMRYGSVRATAIEVSFSYAGTDYVKSSLEERKIAPCRSVFNQYADKEILIAYSPIYDQVMLISPERTRLIWSELSEKGTP
ncbi:MAG: hypothetical protein K2M95_04565 [Clostridiales bacterium]|nr:hypothetical protein [Clostridiales bacterium]